MGVVSGAWLFDSQLAGARRAAISFCIVLGLLAILGALPSPAHATETPVAAYSFDEGEGETANDAFGENDGAIEGAEWIGGKYGTALRFDAEEETLVSIPDDPDLQLTGSFTLEAWVRPQYAQHWLPVITKETEGFFSYQLYAGGEEPGHAEGYVSEKAWEATGVAAPEALPVRTWTHLALTCDGENLRLYEDGELIDAAGACSAQASTGELLIGGNKVFGEHLNGLIDEVRLYDRALGVEEIADDMATAIETPPSQDPVAAYSFDEGEGETANDAFGEHDGAIEGADWVGGKFGRALRFDNEAEDVVTIADAADLQLSGSFTLEAWVRPASSAYWMPVINKETEGFISYQLYAGGLQPGNAEGYVAQRDWEFSEALSSEAMTPRAWTHLALSCDGSNLRLYEDGELIDSGGPCSAQSSSGDLLIGANEVFNERFDGLIDEVRIYNRALGAEEITEDRDTAIETPPSEEPIAAYSFDEGEGETAHDAYGSRDGTIDGAEWVEGKYGQALSFDREAEDSVEIPGTADLDLSDAFTLEAWVKPTENEDAMPAIVKETPAYHGYALYAAGESKLIPQGMVAERNGEASEALAEEPLAINTWAHLALASDGEDLRLYVDGELVDTVPASSAQSGEGALRIGGHDAWGYYFDGLIDEVRVYDRALDLQEINEDRDTAVNGPVGISPPIVHGIPKETRQLSVDGPGEWDDPESLAFSYQWERCSSVPMACANIEGAKSQSYTLTEADVGSRIRLRVQASNSVASAYQTSAKTTQITQSAPRFDDRAEILGEATVGSTLSVDISGLKGSQLISLSYEWERCAEYCTQVGEEPTYALTAADAATQIRAQVIAENEVGSSSSRTPPTSYIEPVEGGGIPVLAEPPRLTGYPRVSNSLETTTGKWIGLEPEISVQWERCTNGLESCEDIPGATTSTYSLSALDEGAQIRSEIAAKNEKGTVKRWSALTPHIYPEVNTAFSLEEPVSLSEAMEAVALSEAMLVSLNYGDQTASVYVNAGLEASEIVEKLSSLLDEEAAELPVRSFVMEGSVPSEDLGGLAEDVKSRSEFVPLAEDEAEEGEATEHLEKYAKESIFSAKLETWSDEKGPYFESELVYREGNERVLKSSFTWAHTSAETIEEIYLGGSTLAVELDLKEINPDNQSGLGGVCLPWETNNFWIGSRYPTVVDTTMPAEAAGVYWDTAALDSCEEKDLSIGIYHPEALESGKIYEIAMYFDGDHLSESAIGDTESSLFSWGVQILGSHCDSSPWCVNIDEVDIEGATLPIIKKDHEFVFDHLFEGYGPADLPGCFEFLNPELWPESGQLLGAHPCIFAT